MNTRQLIFAEIEAERAYQDRKWGHEFDDKNTPNDWAAYIAAYAGSRVAQVGSAFDRGTYRAGLVKVAALAVAALEALDRNDGVPPKRHYD